MIKKLVEKLKTLHLYFIRNNKVPIGCGTCKYKKLEMNNIPCANCVGYYSKWEQSTNC